jgi:hypothetical protein
LPSSLGFNITPGMACNCMYEIGTWTVCKSRCARRKRPLNSRAEPFVEQCCDQAPPRDYSNRKHPPPDGTGLWIELGTVTNT